MIKKTLIRLASAAVAAILFFGVHHYFPGEGDKLLVFLIAVLAQREYARLTLSKDGKLNSNTTLLVLACSSLTAYLWSFDDLFLFALALLSAFFFGKSLFSIRNESEHSERFQEMVMFGWGLIYVGFLPSLILGILNREKGFLLLLTILLVVFLGDTFAYFFGLTFKGKKLIPLVSPNKTWSGSIGGLLGSGLAGFAANHYFFDAHFPSLLIVSFSILAGAAAQIGDLFESLMKRIVGVKDSGHIMPGHGGILDRIDGLLFGAPFLIWLTH